MKFDYNDFYVVCESTVDPDQNKTEIIKVNNTNGVNFIRFRSRLMSFGHRNRNQRLWRGPEFKQMLQAPTTLELLRNGGVPGEPGHPIPAVGQASLERILTIDPDHICHVVKEFIWTSDTILDGILDTIDDGEGQPGYKLAKNLMQGINPAMSARTVVPQRKNRDGTIDVLGPGRYVCHDRVFVPSHEDAYADLSFPVKNIISPSKFETAIESFTSFVYEHSEKVGRVLDGMDIAMESATLGTDGMFHVNAKQGNERARIIVPMEDEYRNILKHSIMNLR